jgi:hypothetical protein
MSVRNGASADAQVALPYRVRGPEIEDERVLNDLPHRVPVLFGDRLVERGGRELRPPFLMTIA